MSGPLELFEGDRLGSYRIVRELGQGGMGAVYEVEQTDVGAHHALKVFTLDHGHVDFLRKRFLTEGKVLERLSHPRLVHVHGLGVDAATDRPYFVMDLVLDEKGNPTTLEDVRKVGKVTEAQAERWFGDLCAALDYCHAQGIVHRDVKLNNILIDATGHAVLSDFGVSRIFDPEVRDELQVTTTFVEGETTGTRPVMGTYWYLAPELRKGAEATAASDWYALGVAFFRLLTGMWYEPGTEALDLLAPYDRRWRERLERLLCADPDRRTAVGRSPRDRRWNRPMTAGIALCVIASVLVASRVVSSRGRGVPAASDAARSVVLAFDATNRLDFRSCPPGTNAYRTISVAVTHPYWLAATPVTRRQWFAVRGEPLTAWEGGEDAPMTYVTREEVTNFCARLNARFAAQLPPGHEIRLPTLAEWRLAYAQGKTVPTQFADKKAMRRASVERGWFGQGSGAAKGSDMRRYYENRNGSVPLVTNIWTDFPPRPVNPGKEDWAREASQVPPVPVALKPANGLGLYDMLGNCGQRVFDTCSSNVHNWGKTEWGATTAGLYAGRGLALTNPVERTGTLPLMVGTWHAPDLAGDRAWSADFDRLPHLGFRLCLGPKLAEAATSSKSPYQANAR